MKASAWIGVAIAAGTAMTVTAAGLGVPHLQALFQREESPGNPFDFLDERRSRASLVDTEIFSSPHVGAAGSPPTVAPEFRAMLIDTHAEEKLLELIRRGASGGRMYGLCGLRILGSNHFNADVLAASRWDDRPLALVQGCAVSLTTPRKVLRSAAFGDICDGWTAVVRAAGSLQRR